MKKSIVITVLFMIALCNMGCDQFTIGAGAGLAGAQTFNQWKENLQAKKVELQEQYSVLQAELDAAIDPNQVKLVAAKLKTVQEQQLVNEGAILAVNAALEIPDNTSTKEDKTDFWAAVILGAVSLGYQTVTKNKLNLKYVSAKTGQAKLAQVNPEAEKQLYAFIGQERTAQGL